MTEKDADLIAANVAELILATGEHIVSVQGRLCVSGVAKELLSISLVKERFIHCIHVFSEMDLEGDVKTLLEFLEASNG